MSRRYDYLILAAALFLALASCKIATFEGFDVTVSVAESQCYYDGEYIGVSFSANVNQAAAQSLISLKEDRKSAKAEILWGPRSCLVKADGGFKKGRRYELSISGEILLDDGRTYGVDLYRDFIYGKESENFFAVKIEEPEKNNFERQALAFCFNKPVNAAVFEREFSVSPSVAVKKKYSEDKKQVLVIPEKNWKSNVFYNWRLGGVESDGGFKALREYSGSFMALEKNESPKVILCCPVMDGTFMESQSLDQLWERQSVGFVFDSDMDFESLKKGTFFSPSVDGKWTKKDSKRFVFVPSENYKIGERHTITISESVEDVYGIKMKEQKNIFFTARSEWIDADFFANGSPLSGEGINWISLHEGTPLIVEIVFSKAPDIDSISKIKSAVSLERLFPLSTAAPNLASIIPQSFKVQMEFDNYDFSILGEEKLYKLFIKGGAGFIHNSQGEYFKEDRCFTIAIKKLD